MDVQALIDGNCKKYSNDCHLDYQEKDAHMKKAYLLIAL